MKPRKTPPKTKKSDMLAVPVQYRFAHFLQDHPPKEFNRLFRNVFLRLTRGHDIHDIRLDNDAFFEGMYDLLRVLDAAEDHFEERDTDELIELYNIWRYGKKLLTREEALKYRDRE